MNVVSRDSGEHTQSICSSLVASYVFAMKTELLNSVHSDSQTKILNLVCLTVFQTTSHYTK